MIFDSVQAERVDNWLNRCETQGMPAQTGRNTIFAAGYPSRSGRTRVPNSHSHNALVPSRGGKPELKSRTTLVGGAKLAQRHPAARLGARIRGTIVVFLTSDRNPRRAPR